MLVGMANYGNIGDLAISEAQLQFMRRYFDGAVLEIPTMHFWEYEKLLKEYLKPHDVLCLQGGGNMSNLYYWFEYERCSVMEVFPKVRTLVLPQTLAYTSQDSSLLRYSQRAYANLYYWFEYERCSVMEVFPKVRTLVLPQTLAYTSQDSSLLRYSQRAYARCSDLHLFAREHVSEELMKKTYPHTDVRLVPDIVLSLDASDYADFTLPRRTLTLFAREHVSEELMKKTYPHTDVRLVPDIVLSLDASDYADFTLPRRTLTTMLRKDDERKLTDADWSIIHEAASAMSLPLKETDTIIETMDITPQQRKVILHDMLNTFASSRVVITDRLHGMIFAAITGTPCVVLSNSNHKIQGVYKWIKDLPYIEFISDVHETKKSLERVMDADTTYPLQEIREKFGPLKSCLD